MDLDQRMLFPADFLLRFKLEKYHRLSLSRSVIAEGSLTQKEASLSGQSAKINDHPLVVINLESIDPKEIFSKAIKASGNATKALECLGRGRKFLELMLCLGTAASEIHPIAKTVMATINVIYKEIQEQEKIDDGTMDLIDRVARCTVHIETLHQLVTYSQLRETLQDFQPLVERCTVFLQRYRNKSAKGRSFIQRWSSSSESESLHALESSFDQFQQHLDRGMAVQTSIVNNKIANDVTHININVTLNNLVYAENCNWQSLPLCLPGTRTEILSKILGWVDAYQASLSGEVLLLTGLAGSGKSAIARSIAQSCSDNNILLSSFFFDREVAGKDDPKALISTIAYDLGKADTNIARALSAILESRDGRRLVSKDASILWQFDEMLLKGCHGFSPTRAFVIVIDALDEGHTTQLIELLGTRINRLPKGFRLVVTSRPDSHLISMLSEKAHVQTEAIDMETKSNWMDLRKYVEYRAKSLVAEHQWLGEGWPGNELLEKFVGKAEGLFLWVSTIFDYLSTVVDPSRVFDTFTSESGTSTSGILAEEKMDITYRQILESCNWNDPHFTEGYRRLMGAIMAARTPLSAKALHTLHDEATQLPITTILNPLRCLLSGLETENRPIRILHQSLRDFITVRARDHTDSQKYYLDIKEHSERLALLCLNVMNTQLLRKTPGMMYLSDSDGIPELDSGAISEELSYACKFWINHLEIVGIPSDPLMGALSTFLSEYSISWMEIAAMQGSSGTLKNVWEWIDNLSNGALNILKDVRISEIGSAYLNLSIRFKYMDRREDALEAAEQAVQLRRRPAADQQGTFDAKLADSLRNLSNCLSDLGRREEALGVIEESVQLYRQLATELPVAFNVDLAGSLNNLSVHLSDLGRREEALEAIEQAVQLRRQLAADRPAVFNAELALSLNNLSISLSELGHREEALEAIEQSVQLYRQLAAELPTVFNADLAGSLNNLSIRLSDLGRREEALEAIEQAVQLRRQLAADRPASFNTDLASSLNTLSNRLYDLGRREEALEAIEQSVQLYRQLAADRPAVFNADLARSLNNLSIRLSDLVHREDALVVIEQAVQLYRQLAADRPAAFNTDLAGSLNTLSNRLYDLGRREEALEVIEQAVQLYRQLAADRPAAFNADLALSLNNLSNRLYDLGRREDALAAIEQAVQLRRQLVADRPAAFNADLALSLHNLSIHLSDLGRREEALVTIEQAVQLRRQLAADRPAVFNTDLASSLRNFSNFLSNLGRCEEALEAIESSVRLYRQLAAEHPAVFNARLASSLTELASILSKLDRPKDALLAEQEAEFLTH